LRFCRCRSAPWSVVRYFAQAFRVVGHDAVDAECNQPAHLDWLIDGPGIDAQIALMRGDTKVLGHYIRPRVDRFSLELEGRSDQPRGPLAGEQSHARSRFEMAHDGKRIPVETRNHRGSKGAMRDHQFADLALDAATFDLDIES